MKHLKQPIFLSFLRGFIAIGLLLLAIPCIQAQSLRISGRVLEAHSEEPVPFANVVVKGKMIVATADESGNYILQIPMNKISPAVDSLVASAVGYKRSTYVIGADSVQQINFFLSSEDYLLNEVTIVLGEDPAYEMLRKMIKNKGKYDVFNSEGFRREVYNKMELDLANFNRNAFDSKLLRPFKFILENIDSISEHRPFLPMFLTETLSDYYYQKEPHTVKEIIKASNVSGVDNESVSQFLGGMYANADVYNNFIDLFGKNMPSPINDNCFFYYKYYLIDSAVMDNKWCYQIKFKPKNMQSNAFRGNFWVADTTFAIKRISMELEGKYANINFLERLTIFQEFDNLQNKGNTYWAMVKNKMIADFVPEIISNKQKNNTTVIGRKTAYYQNFDFNETSYAPTLRNKAEDVVISEDALKKDADFWAKARPDSLSSNEQKIYSMMDTLEKMPVVQTYASIVNTLVSGYYVKGKIELGPYYNALSYNAVQGWRVRLGGRTSNDFSKRVMLTSYVAYGFGDKSWKGGSELLWLPTKKPRQAIRLWYKNDLDIESQSDTDFGQDNLLAGLYRIKGVPWKITNIEQYGVGYEKEWKGGFSNKINLRHRDVAPYFNYYVFDNGNDTSSAQKNNLSVTEMQLGMRFAYKEKFLSGEFERVSVGSDYPIINLNYTMGVKGVLNSEQNYHRLDLSLYDWFYIGSLGYMTCHLRVGKIWGEVPFLLLENYSGNETYFLSYTTFNCINDYEFSSDQYAHLFLTHHFDGIFFNKIPLLKKLKFREIIGGKIGIGSLSSANRRLSTDPTQVRYQIDDILPAWQLQTPTLERPYIEANLGIENIFRFFRVDAIWRLTYNDRPQRPAVKVGMQLLF